MYKKRFIAGAKCPSCNSLDKIFTYLDGDTDAAKKWRACVSCNFVESFDESPSDAEELGTRVNQLRVGEPPLAHELAVDAVKIIDLDD